MSDHLSADCVFCKIIRGEIPCHKVYEDQDVLAFADISPLSKGHCLVVPKHHERFFHLLPERFAQALGPALRRVAAAVVEATGAPCYNIINNNGEAAGQTVPHVHWHVVPKMEDGSGLGLTWQPLQGAEAGEVERVAGAVRAAAEK